ncbi:MAG: PilZ domain-containing protein [bacterium]
MYDRNILLVVADETNRIKYERYLKNIARFDLINGLTKAYQQCLESYYDLILIDLKLGLGQGRSYIDKLNSLSNSPPILKIRPRQESVDVLLLEQRTVEDLSAFLQKFFDKLKEEENISANLRKYKRHKLILRVTMKQTHTSQSLRVNTLNISQGGLFITTPHPFAINKELEIQIYDVAPNPLQAIVRVAWTRPWEIPHQLPGIGAQFLSFAQDTDHYTLMEYLNKLLEKPRGTN